MKAKHFFAVAAVATVSVIGLCSFTTVGNACNELAEEIHTQIHAQGWGTCKWSGCKCPGFKVGGASGAKCSNCGHMDFNHN